MTGKDLPTLRKRLGWSQPELARRMGFTSVGTIHDVESGRRRLPPAWLPRLEQFERAAKLLEQVPA